MSSRLTTASLTVLLAVHKAICFILPFRLQMAICGVLGRCLYLVSNKRRAIARINIGLCFPELTAAAQQQILLANFSNLGRSLFEIGTAWWASDKRIAGLANVQGVEHVERALAAGKGALLVGSHFTALDMSCRLLGTALDFDVSYRPTENPVIDKHILRGRQRGARTAIPKENFRLLLKSLRQNRAVWIAVDQAQTGGEPVMAPFFGIPAPTANSVARIAAGHGCAVIPLFCARQPGNKGYLLRLETPLEHFPSGDALADTTRINKIIEQHVREAPEQYYWIHRRFKNASRPYDNI